ncbi:heme peroxidase [Fusarium heterosporum]|uniref:Heme peroxidase n=1 Tax=Fusarium heterosporum TaxID=42747 RepID=A0A8H5T6M8_FUSHE|nr:heme peroxidase [Fusarium heterosporum]
MYNRYHNYVATQPRRVNENGRFSIPTKYQKGPLDKIDPDSDFGVLTDFLRQRAPAGIEEGLHKESESRRAPCVPITGKDGYEVRANTRLKNTNPEHILEELLKVQTAAWVGLDEDLFQTARL